MAIAPPIEKVPIEKVDESVLKAEAKAAKTSSSKGERLFDWLTYGGIGFLGVFAAGIPIGYWGKYGKGAGMFHSGAKSLEKLGMSAKSAEDAMMTSVLMQPGNIALLPIKLMENNKPHLVDKFNDMLGEKSSDASVEKDPQQTWGSLIKSRLAAWLAVYAGFRGGAMMFGGENFAKFENKFAEYIVCNPLGKPTHIPGMEKIAANETKLFRYGKIASLDVFATAAATILLYVGSRFFAKRNDQWEAKHTHPDNKPLENSLEKTPMVKGLDAIADNTSKIFTQSVTPQSEEIKAKPRPASFTEAVTNQKAQTAEAVPSLSA